MARSLEHAIQLADEFRSLNSQREVFIIGGASLYAQALSLTSHIYLTRVHLDVEGDSYLPQNWLDGFAVNNSSETLRSRTGVLYSFIDYIRQ